MTTDVRQLWRIENICICWTGKFSLRLGAKEEPEGRRLHWIPDTRKKQWIPFDVNRKFVLLTKMNKYGFLGQGPTGRTKGTSKGDDFATRDKSNTFFLTPDNWLQNHYHLWINECLSASPKWRQSLETLGLDMRWRPSRGLSPGWRVKRYLIRGLLPSNNVRIQADQLCFLPKTQNCGRSAYIWGKRDARWSSPSTWRALSKTYTPATQLTIWISR